MLKLLIPLTFLFFVACNSREERGKLLAEKHCGSCHLPVSPSLLTKEIWTKHVLPAMAPKLGIGVWEGDQYYVTSAKQTGPVSFEDWNEIVAYYKKMAPDSLTIENRPLTEDADLFSIQRPAGTDSTKIASTTMLSVHNGKIYTGNESALQIWDNQLQGTTLIKLESPAVNMYWLDQDTALLTCIGDLRAVDAPKGTLWKVSGQEVKTIGLGLPRPVQSIGADFNKDGLTDHVVCGFGHNYGGLYVFEQQPDGEYQKKAVWEVAGAEHAVTGDFNGDGWPDIMALFAYGDEGIWVFLNDKKGGFTSENVLRFPPVYGSTSFQIVDWNKDGKPDIIYTSGDNADYSMELKPYHGIYIYLNKGDIKFEQAYFYPMNGCTKAIAQDFDGDGDLDIAAIAFFADLQHHPEEKFIYFEQTKSLQFTPHAVPGLKTEGRWICMETGDYDGDGDIDIVLGNFARGFIIQEGFTPDWRMSQPFIVLKNNKIATH